MILKDKRYIVLFLTPALFLIAVFLLVPLANTIYYSFTAWYNFSPRHSFIGFDNYRRLITDPVIFKGLNNTAILIVGVVIFQIGVSLALALLADSARHMFKFFRTVYFFPIVISATAIGLMFNLIYKYDYGLLNYLVGLFGVDKQVWINEQTAIYLVLIPVVWQYVGFYFVIFLTGISKIPSDVYESAMLDGIKPFQKAIYITIPLMKDVIYSSLILVISGCFKVFDVVYVITKGGPMDASQLLSTYMYQTAFEHQNGGYASAIAIVMIILGIGITTILQRMTKEKV